MIGSARCTAFLTLLASVAVAPFAGAQEALREAELSAGDIAATWHTQRGLGIQYQGIEVFEPSGSEFTVHDAKWTTAFFSSSTGGATASVAQEAGANVLEITDKSEEFSYTKRVTVSADNRLVVEYEFGQEGLEDGHLQLGWRPAVPWLDGAGYEVKTAEKSEEGRMTYGRGEQRVLWSGLREMSFSSLFGTWRMKTSHEMTLYDDRDKGTFFLGWDQKLEEGERYRETVELTLEPSSESIGGVRVSDFEWTRQTEEGYAHVRCMLARDDDGPHELKLSLQALRGDEQIAAREVSVALAATPTPVELRVPLPRPGEYVLRLVATDAADGSEVLRAQALEVAAKAVMRFVPSLSLYNGGEQAQLIIELAAGVNPEGISARLEGDALEVRTIALTRRETVVPLDLAGVADGVHRVTCSLRRGEDEIARGEARFAKAPAKPNQVRIDYRTRGLIVDGKPFFPFGFYFHRGTHYDQEDPQYVLRLEGAFKFNLICVYHSFDPEFRREKRPIIGDFLDKADGVGMRMHYDVRKITDQEPSEEIRAALAEEVTAHRDAPALLCWYLSDEPAGRGTPPDRYIAHNAHMKQLDPHHPTTMVFCVPSKAHQYVEGMDILMVDPYPIPNRPVTSVADTVDLVLNATSGSMPIWCVPQAFGGGEAWGREPTWQEQRCMTYLAIVHGATGIQYFIRRPPHNNPFVDGMWAECRKMAAEIRELTPVLLSNEPAPEVALVTEDPALHTMARRYEGAVYVFCINTENQPKNIALKCPETPLTHSAQVLFEDRTVSVTEAGEIRDIIGALGVGIYCVRVEEPAPNEVTLAEGNLIRNGGFEQQTNPGYPDYYRVNYTQETGASWGADSLEAVEGRHSLFIRCPADGEGLTVTSYPMGLKAGEYRLTVYVRADRDDMSAHLQISGFKGAPGRTVDLGRAWQQESIEFNVPENVRRTHFGIRPDRRGVIWVDAIEVREVQ